MKKIFAATFVLVLAGTATAHAGVNFSVNVGVPAPVVVGTPAPVPVAVSEAPRFIYSPDLGYYVSVGTPYQMVYAGNCYYRYSGGSWYLASSYGGRWSPVPVYRVPEVVRRHSFREVAYYRDREFRHFERDREHYRGRWFRPEHQVREEHREYRGEERREHDGRDGRWDRR